MSLLFTVTAMAFSLFAGAFASERSARDRADATGQARLALARLDRQLRSGSVLGTPVQCDAAAVLPCSLTVYTQAAGARRCVQWQVHQRTLRGRDWSPSWRSDSDVRPWEVLAHSIVNAELDRPGDASDAEPFTAVPARPDDPSTPGVDESRQTSLIVADLRAQVSADGGEPAVLRTAVSGRNTNYGFDTGVCSDAPAP